MEIDDNDKSRSRSGGRRKMATSMMWPDQVTQLYDPVRVLGRGKFATVMLARPKRTTTSKNRTTTTAAPPPSTRIKEGEVEECYPGKETVVVGSDGEGGEVVVVAENNNVYHALKVVGSKHTTGHEEEYARREMEILRELDHPNIVRLLGCWEPSSRHPTERKLCVAVMALSYHTGPTLEQLLRHGGRLSLLCARIVSAQLIDAVAYLHTRACVHRDIKPDNVIVSTTKHDDEIWDDPSEHDGPITTATATTTAELVSYRQRWHVTLIDFGFARALTPSDFQKGPPPVSPPSKAGATGGDRLAGSSSKNLSLSKSQHSSSSHRAKGTLNRSASRQFNRQMSALGNRDYVAPEILQGIHHDSHHHRVQERSNQPILVPSSSAHVIDVTRTLSEHVSFYGLMADAYSIGNTIKYMVTGVPPYEDVNDAIEYQNNPIVRIVQLLGSCCCTTKSSNDDDEVIKRVAQYRRMSCIPPVVLRLVRGLTDPDPQKRTTVSAARRYPWIDDVLEDGNNKVYDPTTSSDSSINYLSFTLEKNNNNVVVEHEM